MSLTKIHNEKLRPLLVLPACFLLASLFSGPVSAVDCPADVDVDRCTANDLQPTGSEIIAGPSSCTAGETIALTLRVKFEDGGGASDRFDVGFFIGDNGGPAIGGDSCTFASLTPLEPPLNLTSGAGGFRNVDGDACGDIARREATYKDIQLNNVLCKDDDGDGQVDIAYTLTWDNNQNDSSCTDPADPDLFAPAPPKCRADLSYDLPIKVEQPPTIEASKVALPAALREPGGDVLFRVGVANTSPSSTDPVTITSITDAPYGDISDATSCSLPFTLAPGERRVCEFTRTITGTSGQVFPDTVTFSGSDDEGTPVSASADANVLILSSGSPPQPGALELRKFALPGSLPEPGGEVLYLVAISNPGEQNVELQTMIDDLYGDLDGQGNCSLPQLLTPGGTPYLCGFTQTVNGPPGTQVKDTIIATGTDAVGTLMEASDDATVEITDLGSAIRVLKSPEPGGIAGTGWRGGLHRGGAEPVERRPGGHRYPRG